MRREIGSIAAVGMLALPSAIAHHSRAGFLNETVALEGEVVAFCL